MTKEEIFTALKEVILVLRDEGEKFLSDKVFQQECLQKQAAVQQAVKELNSCDMLWLSEVYEKWFTQEIRPYADKLDPDTKAKLGWH